MKAKHPNKSEEANRKVRLVLPKKATALSPRLKAAAELVRPGSVVADIGTDHAYLPIYLVKAGIVPHAVACDLREGPLSRAAAHVAASGLSDQIELVLTDGLKGIERYAPDDILICGMGGELIIRILSDSDYVRNSAVRLILQPMTGADRLRSWLYQNGFKVCSECLSPEDDRIYELIAARYCGNEGGESRSLSEARAIAGFAEESPYFEAHLRRKLSRLQKQIDGFERSGRDAGALLALKAEMEGFFRSANPIEPTNEQSSKGDPL